MALAGEGISATEATTVTLRPERIKEIAGMLAGRPTVPGKPITDRKAWEKLGRKPGYSGLVKKTEPLISRPLPEQPDDLYLEFSRNGNRTNWQNIAFDRRRRLTSLVLAECLENRGRFLPAIEDLVTTLCAERTWVFPAHDRGLVNFKGKRVTIDLASSALASNLAMADYLLGEKMRTVVRARLRESVDARVLTPFRNMIRGTQERDHWLTTTNNWNAVCLAGVVGAALAQLDSDADKAEFIAAAEEYSKYFLSGFTSDGYCSEGLGYWNYGFGNFAVLSEMIRFATGNGIELLAQPEARMPALFGVRIEIMNGVSPAFADCSTKAKPSPQLMWLLNRRLGLGLDEYTRHDPGPPLGDLGEAMLRSYPGQDPGPRATAASKAAAETLRTWFDKAGVLICRPAPGSKGPMAVALKGGNNAEHHNHNDLGSYVVLIGSEPVLLDPGGEVYTARTFSSKRYDSKMLNSFGHPVPVVGGKLQSPGSKARAEVLGTELTERADTLRLDLRSAYDCPALKKLERTFKFERRGGGKLTVTDHVEFSEPQTFSTALITAGTCKDAGGDRLVVTSGAGAVHVGIDCGGLPYELVPEQIKEDAPVKPTRIGIDLKEPVTSATVVMTISPATSVK
jgi:hypothetical protein